MPQPTIQIKDAAAVTQTIFTINPNGQALAADAQPVVLPAVQETALRNVTATATAPAAISATTSAQMLAANTSRKKWSVFNNGPGLLYVLRGTGTATPSNSSLPAIPAGGYYESDLGSTEAVQYVFGSTGTGLVQELF